MVDIAQIKADIRKGLITVYQEGAYIYMENIAGERIVLTRKEEE